MSWTKLFKSRSSTPDPDPRLRWFGKLPTYPDYYRSQATEEWPDEFHTWVLQGFEMYKGRLARENHPPGRLPVSSCVLRLPKSDMTVFSSVLDFGGDMRGRVFPMCFYVGIPTSKWRGPPSERIRAATQVLDRLVSMERDVARFLNQPGQFETLFADREVDLYHIEENTSDDTWSRMGTTVPLSHWFDGVRSGLHERRFAQWRELIGAWGKNISRHDRKGFEPTLRFPLAKGVPASVQVAGWFRWLESRMDFSKRSVSFTITGDLKSEMGALTIISREIMPDDFLLLTPMFGSLPYLDDSCALGNNKTDAAAAPDTSSPDASAPAEPAGGASEQIAGATQDEAPPPATEDDMPPLSWSEFVQQ